MTAAARHLMVVLSNAVDGHEAEFNEWYDAHMLDTIDKLDGFAAAQRFELADLDGAPEVPYRYLALYEIEGDRIARAFEQFLYGRAERAEAEAAGRPPMISVSDTLDRSSFLVGFYSSLAESKVSRRLQEAHE